MKRQISAARRQIVVLLRRKGPQTVDALSAAVGITAVAVRKHLDTLEIDGLVHSTTQRRPIGRPVQVYSLTDAADDLFPQAYDSMLAAVLRQVRRLGGEELLQQVLDGRRAELAAACRERAAGATSLEEWVEALVRVRDEAGYMAEWTRQDGAYILTEYNCALCRVSREFPQVCKSEMELFQGLLGDRATVRRDEHLLAGGRRCTYIIRERAAA